MSDQGGIWTDMYVYRLEKRIRETYEEAQRDIEAKIEEFKRKYKAKESILSKKLKDGEITQSDYNDWLRGQMFQGQQWINKKNQIIGVISEANKIATKISNEHRGNVFIENSNYQAYLLEHGAGVNFGFGLYDSSAVAKLIRNWNSDNTLPMWKIDEPKDYIWNSRVVNNAITQGIIQGESLDKIAKRLSDGLVTKNRNKMLTFARTGMTQAQNAGRLDRLKEAEGMKIKVHKEWMATLDERTRTTHQILDGKKVPIDKPFRVDNYEINYPGDPTAHPAMVYNCRCTLVGDLDDYPSEYERYDNINGKPIKNMTYEEWKNAKGNPVVPEQTDGKFETIRRIMNSPTTAQMTDAQKAEFEKLLGGMSDENLGLYEAMTAFHGNSNYINGGGWYSPSKHIVEMTLSDTDWERAMNRPDIAAWKVKFHEELHQLDHLLGISQGYGVDQFTKITTGQSEAWRNKTPIGERLHKAIKKDIEDFINNGIDYYNDAHGSHFKHVVDLDEPLPPGARKAFFEYLDLMYGIDDESKASVSAFTDAVGLFTRDRISPYSDGWWGHNPSYNKDRGPNGATSECWAEIGSHILRDDQRSLSVLKEVMPTSVSEYESAIHEAAEYAKTYRLHY